ncbi:MAG: tryptophan--tRNA ligase [Firmicutes bacterium]|jgi:tryptophanyl-tRNA synthetase|nr:tryptophan--tRNA ligase [Bacillota bacterium]
MRPTGPLQLGNFLGALDNWVKLQHEDKCYFFVADWHALTTGYEDTEKMKENIRLMVIDWLSAGIDPEKSVVFRQSDLKEHAELHLLLSMITPLSWLERCPTYKDQLQQLSDRNITTYGFLGYPCLMAADILMYKPEFVPVGEDQLPHLELTREIARRFNFLYGPVFPEPQAKMTKVTLLPGLDGRKMSKSYGNTISMSGDPDEIREKVAVMITDPARARRKDPGDPEKCTVFTFHKIFSPPEALPPIVEGCKTAGIGCVDCKKQLMENMIAKMDPIYRRRQSFLAQPSLVDDILAKGAEEAREVAQRTMSQVREAMKL